jgi:hypothetical protein
MIIAKNATFLLERGVDLSDPHMELLTRIVCQNNMARVFEPPCRASILLVNEFYKNASPFRLHVVPLRGKLVDCSPSAINKTFQAPKSLQLLVSSPSSITS